MKKSIVINRPDGKIAGFRAVNDRLAEFGLVLEFVVEMNANRADGMGEFVEMRLLPAGTAV